MKKILALLTIVLIFLTFMVLRAPAPEGSNPPPALETSSTVIDDTQKTVGGPFTLTDQDGKSVSDADFRGRLMLVFFGFTHCPDICPVSTANLSKAMELLGPQGDSVAPLFISVDPKRDTPAVLKDYLAHFDKRMTGLTGTEAQVKATVDAYKAYVAESDSDQPEDDAEPMDSESGDQPAHRDEHARDGHAHDHEDYGIDHSGFIYLMGKDGAYITHFPYDAAPADIAAAVRSHL